MSDLKPQPLSALTSQFSLDLFQTLVKERPTGNVFISPLSIASSLVMMLNGASGDTYQAMAEVLRVADMSLSEINATYQDLLASLARTKGEEQVRLLTSLWGNRAVMFKADFQQRASASFDAWLSSVDFDSLAIETKEAINGWVSAKTNGLIERLVESVDPATVLLLISVAAFKGKWDEPFKSQVTKPGQFALPDGRQKPVQMMYLQQHQRYFEDENRQAVWLPYRSRLTGMLVILPREGVTLAKAAADLTAEHLAQWIDNYDSRPLNLWLPRFKVVFSRQLNQALSDMGMSPAFDAGRATFADLAVPSKGLFISDVYHEAVLRVCEEGTEAFAATILGLRMMGIDNRPPIDMRVNRPFLVAIADFDSMTLLFLGAINNPDNLT